MQRLKCEAQRWDAIADYDFAGNPAYLSMTKMDAGEYVTYDDHLAALAREREAALDECLRIVKAECELPGPMPDEMWEAIKDDKDAAAELARIGVRKTKWNIAVAIEALKAVGVNQAAG